jgi:lactate racemase
VRERLVFGEGFVEADLPDDTHLVSPGLSLPLHPVPDLAQAVREALEQPLESPPLVDAARGARRVTIAFDDPTVPCYAPVWSTAIPIVLKTLERAGVARDRVTLLCANALHRQCTRDELAKLIGADLARGSQPTDGSSATTPRIPRVSSTSARRTRDTPSTSANTPLNPTSPST